MRYIAELAELALVFLVAGCAGPERGEADCSCFVYRGAGDASAVVPLSKDLIIAGDDETNTLRVYRTTGGLPVASYDLTDALDIEPEHPEADIEGATAIGDRIYWITSHGRNKDGELRPNRYRFFATDVQVQHGRVAIEPVGPAFKTLAQSMVMADAMGDLGLEAATRFDAVNLSEAERKKLAPKAKGLNIEALCASADGAEVFIGLRNPLPLDPKTGRPSAIVERLENAAAVIEAHEAPVFGRPMLWDLGGRGIRSLDYSEQRGEYFVLAGACDERSSFALYRWSGDADEQPELEMELDPGDLHPEALALFKGTDAALMVSDDGNIPVDVSSGGECVKGKLKKDGTCPNKFLVDPAMKTFRGAWLGL